MTNRYDLLINAIAESNAFIAQTFLYALFAVIAYRVLDWTPHWMRRPVKYLYLAAILALFFITVFFAQ